MEVGEAVYKSRGKEEKRLGKERKRKGICKSLIVVG